MQPKLIRNHSSKGPWGAAVVVVLEAMAARGGEWCGGSYRSEEWEYFWGSPKKFSGGGGGGGRRWLEWWPEIWERERAKHCGLDNGLASFADIYNCTKINMNNKSVNETLTAKLERYKEQVKVLKGQNVDVKSRDKFSDSHEQNAEIDRLKQILFEQLQENKFVMKTVTVLTNDFKKEESRDIDREIALEKKIKHLDNIVYKRDQLAQSVHMLTKPKFFYDHSTKKALGFQNPFYLKKAQQLEPKLYDGDALRILNSKNSSDPNLSKRPTTVEVPKELPKVSMVNTRLKKLKHHLAGFDVVIRERTTPTTITEGSWGFEHTKACFRDEIIPFVKEPNDIFNTFDQYLTDEFTEVQNVFHQMEHAVEQYRLESKTFEVKMNQVLSENERLLEQVINKNIVNIVMNSFVDNASVNMHECKKCLELETELLNKKNFIEKETYDKLLRSYTTLEEHCISLEVDTQLNQEIFQRNNSVSNQSAPSFNQYFQRNNSEQGLIIAALRDELRKLKGKAIVDNIVTTHTINPEMLIVDVEPISPRLLNNRTVHSDYLRLTHEQAVILREVVEQGKSLNPLNNSLDHACKYIKRIQELLILIRQTCPSINNSSVKLVVVTPKNKDNKVRFTEPVTFLGNTNTKTTSSSNLVFNKPMLSSTGVKPSTSASRSQPSGNTKKDKIQQPPSSTQKNKVEANPRTVKFSLKNKNYVVEPKGTATEANCSSNRSKPVVTLVYSRKPGKSKNTVHVSKSKVVQIVLWYLNSGCSKHMTGDRSQLTNFVNKFLGKSKKKPHKPKSKDTNQEKLYLLHMDLCGPMRVASVNGKKYIIVIVDDYSRFTWVGISHETSVARSPQQNSVVERRIHTLIEIARTMLIYAQASLFLWAEAVATTCYPQNRSIICLHHGKTPYELLHGKLPDPSFLYAFRIYNRRTRRIIKAIHVDFDELTTMASEQSSSGPVFHEMTPGTINTGLVPKPTSSTPFVPPSRIDWDLLFQPLFDELLTPPPSVDPSAPKVIAPIAKVVAP
nr:hypothetical protein [Tanacetum cinerariifolium]